MLTFRAGVEGRQLPPAREGHLRPRHGPTVGVELTKKKTLALGARHSLLVTLDHGYYPISAGCASPARRRREAARRRLSRNVRPHLLHEPIGRGDVGHVLHLVHHAARAGRDAPAARRRPR